jgi:hypothetical protein
MLEIDRNALPDLVLTRCIDAVEQISETLPNHLRRRFRHRLA